MLFVKNILDTRLLTTEEEATKLIDFILEELLMEEILEINFAGIDVITSNFSSPFFSKLYTKVLTRVSDKRNLRFKGLSPSQKSLFDTSKEDIEEKLGLQKIYFPKSKVELINLIELGLPVSVRINSVKEFKEAQYFLVRNIRSFPVKIYKEHGEDETSILAKDAKNGGLLTYSYLSASGRNKDYIIVLPWYQETPEMKEYAVNWSDLE